MSNILAAVESSNTKEEYREVKVVCMGKDDVRTATEAGPVGIDSAPLPEMIAVYAETVDKADPVIVGYLNAPQLAQAGEVRLYSTDTNGKLKFYAWLKGDGTMEIGGNADNMVRYSKLEAAFNQLKQDHDDLVSAFNSHMHATAGTGAPSPPTPGSGIPAVPSTADISQAKINEIKTL